MVFASLGQESPFSDSHIKKDRHWRRQLMKAHNGIKSQFMNSMVFTGIGLAGFYWVCESFMYFFLEPEANFIQHLLGPDIFETWTRVLVLCLFVIFGSHFQYTTNKQRLADEALRESEEKYRSILESIEEGYFETDLNYNLTFFSDPFCRILGGSRPSLIGQNIMRYTNSTTSEKLKRACEKVRQSGGAIQVDEFVVFVPGNSERELDLSLSLLHDTDDSPSGYRGVLRDVTERKQAEEEKKKLEGQLQMAHKMESIGTLAGGIAHDFNNILMGIQGNASLLLLKVEPDHPGLDKIKNIETYVQSGTELTQQLLGFARRGKYLVAASDINEIINKSATMFGRTRKEVQIHTELADNAWTVEVDRGQIEQALLNLYVNAWQAMPIGGELYLKTENVLLDETFVQPYDVSAGNYVKVTISDTGVGIDKETQSRIFEPFFTTKEMGRGTGLGLASVYGIIKNHGGYINVYSEKDQGTTFSIYLPASEKEALTPQEDIHVPISRGSGTILLIDDEQMILDVGSELLEELGYDVMLARSGAEALELYSNQRNGIDLVIMDMIMPGLGGGETFDRLKEIDPEIKVLLSSGYSINGQATKILDRGCDGFIQKPFNMQQLSEKIREIIDR